MKKAMKSCLLLLATGALLFSCASMGKSHSFTLSEVVQLDSGRISGAPLENSTVVAFRGIPYAAPPVGELRWKAPRPVAPWEGVKAAETFGNSAWQQPQQPYRMWSTEFIIGNKNYSEDCLTLNVWSDSDSHNGEKPVIVFFHGGGLNSGGSSCEVYFGDRIAEKDVVYVSVNYRLGIFGFLGLPELDEESPQHVSGNYGVLDAIASLEWVQNNIAAFGGDPGNVTIMGQSAGSRMVHLLSISPLAEGLFHKAVAQSANPLNSLGRRAMATVAEQEDLGKTMMDYMGVSSLEELRAMDGEELAGLANHFMAPGNPPGFPTKPTIDGFVIPAADVDVYKEGSQIDVPLLAGGVSGDTSIIGPRGAFTLDQYKQMAADEYGEMADEFLALYPASSDEEADYLLKNDIVHDQMNVRIYELAKARAIHGDSATYLDIFTHALPAAGEVPEAGAFHTGDVPYFLNIFYQDPTRPWTEEDYAIGDQMSDYLVNFARTGNPNGEGLAEWPACDGVDFALMELGDNMGVYDGVSPEKVDFWKAYFDNLLGL